MAKSNWIVPVGLAAGAALLYTAVTSGKRALQTIEGLEFSFVNLKIPSFTLSQTTLPIELSVVNPRNDAYTVNRIIAKVYLVRNGKPNYLGYVETTKGLQIKPAVESRFWLQVKVSNLNLLTIIPDFLKDKVTQSLQIKIDGFAHVGHLQFPLTKVYNLKKKAVSGVGALPADILTAATRSMGAAQGQSVVINKAGLTRDIMNAVVSVSRQSKGQTAALAPALRGKNEVDTLRNVWRFVRTYIRYQIDPKGQQFVKTPARSWADRFADCKSLSIFVKDLLDSLGIKSAFRFASYRPGEFTHVYVVAFPTGAPKGEYVLDACLSAFDVQKAYVRKEDLS